jgi:hypothetical protein
MTPPSPTHLRVELEHDGEAIAGRVSDAHGASLEFSGWVGLAAAIERLAAGARAGPQAA